MSHMSFPQNYSGRLNSSKGSVLKKGIGSYGLEFLMHVGAVVVMGVMLVITLSSSGEKMTRGHVLKLLEKEQQNLVRLNEINDNEISRVRTLNFIKDSSHVRNMRSPMVVTYVDGETAIAKN